MIRFFKHLLDQNAKTIRAYSRIVEQINALEDDMRHIPQGKLKDKTQELKKALVQGKTEEEILPHAFALVREAARRSLNMRHFDVQLIAGIALHRGNIAEQKTGEGKTLTATTALYLNALSGKGAHLVTVNDYLVRRDAGWMGRIFNELGMSVGAITTQGNFIFDPAYTEPVSDWRLNHLRPASKKEAYDADITYGINSEFGFDYLRDNMATSVEHMVQRGFNYAIVDEADSVLIDEARTPHIISAPVEDDVSKFYTFARLVKQLKSEEHYKVDEKLKTAHLTDEGIRFIEKSLGVNNIYETDYDSLFYIEAALKAHTLYHNNKEYIVRDGEVIIVDEFTGRLLPGRRFSEGLHQAIEAKEGVPIQRESRTLATVSLQNYFRMYKKLAGMTGTAATEAEEFNKIYKTDVVVIPTHMPNIRKDLPDAIYKTVEAKFKAVAERIRELNAVGRPVLVGTTSIENNEQLSRLLHKMGVKHEVLNAKNHEKEAEIIANAGKKGAVTVATNMAGRGVDIILGGNPPTKPDESASKADHARYKKELEEWQKNHDEVVKLGGLVVIGTERHESRRIDNQLRGRAGRQGDPGETQFFISLRDDLMRIFGGERIANLMNMPFFNMPDDMPLSHPMVSSAIEQAQIKVEGHNFDIRKHLVEYDDVLNKQREIIYSLRRQLLLETQEAKAAREKLFEVFERYFADLANGLYLQKPDDEQAGEMARFLKTINPLVNQEELTDIILNGESEEFITYLTKKTKDMHVQKEKEIGEDLWPHVISTTLLQTIDDLWSKHLTNIEHLREGIGLRGYAQLDPLVEYKKESFRLFEELMRAIDEEFVRKIFYMQLVRQEKSRKDEPAQAQDMALSELEARYAHLDEKSRQKLIKKHLKKHGKKK